MRPSVVVVVGLALPASHAAAERTGGGSGGGGALGHVSSGMSSASHASSSSSGGGGSSGATIASPCDTGVYRYRDVGAEEPGEAEAAAESHYTGDRARFEMYAGAQKVHDSDGSWTIEAAVTDYRFRLTGSIAHYFENRSGTKLTMTMPSLTAGARIDDLGATAVFVQAGLVHAGTKGDPMADSSIFGPLLGIRVEHALSRHATLIGDAVTMWFGHDIRANSARAGIRLGPVEGSFRVLDFNVGPPLYGPELGLRF